MQVKVGHLHAIALFASILYANLGILTAAHAFTLEGYNICPPTNVCIGLAFTQFTGLLLFKVLFNIKQKIRRWTHKPGPAEGNGDDDWELYEEAALKREREAEMEREADVGGIALKEIVSDKESANSFVSLPTYGI